MSAVGEEVVEGPEGVAVMVVEGDAGVSPATGEKPGRTALVEGLGGVGGAVTLAMLGMPGVMAGEQELEKGDRADSQADMVRQAGVAGEGVLAGCGGSVNETGISARLLRLLLKGFSLIFNVNVIVICINSIKH